MTVRRSNLSLILIRLQVGDLDCLLFQKHRKWGDWSLVGGHVEAGEEGDWLATAKREANEELIPLSEGEDFAIEPSPICAVEWGPVPSRSTGGKSTIYCAHYFLLRFLLKPNFALAQLPPEEFCLFPAKSLSLSDSEYPISDTFERLRTDLGEEFQRIGMSWPNAVPAESVAEFLDRRRAFQNRPSQGKWSLPKMVAG